MRPRLYKRYNFHLGEQELTALQAVAYRDRTTVSDLIRVAITDYLRRDRQRPESAPAGDPAVIR